MIHLLFGSIVLTRNITEGTMIRVFPLVSFGKDLTPELYAKIAVSRCEPAQMLISEGWKVHQIFVEEVHKQFMSDLRKTIIKECLERS